MLQRDNNEMESNLKELFFMLLRKTWIIILAGIICAIGFGAYSYYARDPIYTSSTKIYVINREHSNITTIADLQAGNQLTKDYKVLVLSRPVTELVIENLNLNMSHEELVEEITVNTPENTRIIEIEVNNENPELAKKLADSIAEVSAERMMSVMEMEKVNIVEPGNLPRIPTSPNVLLSTVIGGTIGILISAFIILFVHMINDTIKNSDELEKCLELTTLGILPLEVNHNRKEKQKRNNSKKRGFEDLTNMEKSRLDFASIEAYKTLRSNIQFCGADVKVICITSSIPNEGKTFIALRLAKTIAESGKKVLLINADLRKSIYKGKVKTDNDQHGLSQYLMGKYDINTVIKKTSIENLNIISTGATSYSSSELLDDDLFKELIKSQRDVYDYVIVDTPPLGVLIDSANVAKVCDGTLFIVEANKISYKLARRVIKQLERCKCNVIGTVLNKVNINRKELYTKYYQNYYI
ncbi:MAG: polysaccharide biosynthesis tyrosine autokinase [Herbinix sp.]|nr:polysaccharide biosynthesis tyrosine autokinase [Herbinix sp.]